MRYLEPLRVVPRLSQHTLLLLAVAIGVSPAANVYGQAVCLPAPRLLTTKPMGGQVGQQFDIKITGEHIEDAERLRFSDPRITATVKLNEDGSVVPNTFTVSIAEDCPTGIHEARLLTRLGVSSSRVFTVGDLPEVTQSKPNTSLETALTIEVNSVCNAVLTKQAVDFYRFQAAKGQRIVVDCAAQGIDSKLKPVLIVADGSGADLKVQRRGGAIDFTVPESGDYVVKVHDLTYEGGPYHFYRLCLRELKPGQPLRRLPSTRSVSSFSWPPAGLPEQASGNEAEPNNIAADAQTISLPCDLAGAFFPAADVDTYRFQAKKGEVWWVEVASERLGRPTDASIVVQHVATKDGKETLTDVAELSDIPSPVKVSSNGYSYDGPPYNAGSTDVLGKVEIKQDGWHQLQIRDLFGGTRSDPQNVYRLVIRKAQPDFALVGWALHMNLRNGDRNALSKPIALRGGATMPIEVVAVRRDGFNGEIELAMDQLPAGVSATGLTIPAGQSRGIVLITADESAPRGLASARFIGRAEIDGEKVERRCHLASMKWPVKDANREIPSPRLLSDVPVSVCDSELAPITIAPAESKTYEVVEGGTLTIPLKHTRRCDFSGANISLKTYGPGFERNSAFDAPLNESGSTATIDLAKLKTKPGEYHIAFYGSAVAKYRYHPEAVEFAKLALDAARKRATELAETIKQQQAAVRSASSESKTQAEAALAKSLAEQKQAAAAVKSAEARFKMTEAKAKPKDIVDIVVSTPIKIRVTAAEKKQ